MGQKRKRMGRPPLPKAQKKEKRIALRMTDADYQTISARAVQLGQDVSSFLRLRGLM